MHSTTTTTTTKKKKDHPYNMQEINHQSHQNQAEPVGCSLWQRNALKWDNHTIKFMR